MSIIQTLRNRRSIRTYIAQEVEEAKIAALLEAASLAPNDRLREPWHFYIIEGAARTRYEALIREFLQELYPDKPNQVEEGMIRVQATPVIMIATSDIIPDDPGASDDNEYAVACAIHSMWLTAAELGLGMVWRTRGIGLSRDARLYQFIGSPSNKKIIGTLFIGYPATSETAPTPRTDIRAKVTKLAE